MMTMVRFPKGMQNARQHGAKTWLNLVWACNEIEPGFFAGSVSSGPWWSGGTCEEYPDARIIHTDDSVRIVGTTAHGDAVIAAAAGDLGVRAVAATPDEVAKP